MPLPVEADYAVLSVGNGADPEVFRMVCGITGVSIQTSANTTENFRRECDAPNQIATAVVKVTGKSQTVEGTGIIDADELPFFLGSVGYRRSFTIELFQNIAPDEAGVAPDEGTLLGTLSGTYLLTASSLSVTQDSENTGSVTLQNSGGWTYTPVIVTP